MRWRIGLLLAGIAVIAVAGYAVGAGKSPDQVLLCAKKKGGDLSLAAKGKCGKGEKKLTISQRGAQGPVGPQGAQGPAGADATAAVEPVTYVKSPATTACETNPGTFCKPGSLSGEWENFRDTFGTRDYERTGFFKDGEGFVHLVGVAGWISSGGIGGGFVPEGPFYLPAGYRPKQTEMFIVPSGHTEGEKLGSFDRVEVRPNGLVWTEGNLISLSGITFRP